MVIVIKSHFNRKTKYAVLYHVSLVWCITQARVSVDLPVYQEELCFCFLCINIPTLTFPTLNLANSNFPNFEKFEYGNSNFPNFAQKI